MSKKGPHPCAICSNLTTMRCGGCHIPYYCDRNCQKQDWKGKFNYCLYIININKKRKIDHKPQCLSIQEEKTTQVNFNI